MAYQSYKNLQVWQKSMDFAVMIYDVIRKFPREEKYGLAEYQSQILSDLELHENQCHHSGHCGKGAGGNLHYGLTKCGYGSFPGFQPLVVFLHVSVEHDYGIVYGQSQLQYHIYRI